MFPDLVDDFTTGVPVMTYDVWQRIYTETLADGTIREVYGKMNGTSGDTKVIEYKISINE